MSGISYNKLKHKFKFKAGDIIKWHTDFDVAWRYKVVAIKKDSMIIEDYCNNAGIKVRHPSTYKNENPDNFKLY